MTPSDVETMLDNLNTRTTAIEQILPTLATKDDLKKGLDGVEARIDGLTTQMLSLHENVKGEYKLLAEHLANVPTDIRELRETVAVIPELRDDIRLLTQSIARMSQDLGNRLDQLAQKIDSPRRRR